MPPGVTVAGIEAHDAERLGVVDDKHAANRAYGTTETFERGDAPAPGTEAVGQKDRTFARLTLSTSPPGDRSRVKVWERGGPLYPGLKPTTKTDTTDRIRGDIDAECCRAFGPGRNNGGHVDECVQGRRGDVRLRGAQQLAGTLRYLLGARRFPQGGRDAHG